MSWFHDPLARSLATVEPLISPDTIAQIRFFLRANEGEEALTNLWAALVKGGRPIPASTANDLRAVASRMGVDLSPWGDPILGSAIT